jgi:hypothetical protein
MELNTVRTPETLYNVCVKGKTITNYWFEIYEEAKKFYDYKAQGDSYVEFWANDYILYDYFFGTTTFHPYGKK